MTTDPRSTNFDDRSASRHRPGTDVSVHASPGDPVGGRLRDVAALFEDRDRKMGLAVAALVDVQHADGLHDRLGGMTLQVWLEHACRIPGADARALLGAIDVLGRMPSLVVGLCDRWLSWSQVAAICRAARGAPVARLDELDELVSGVMIDMAGFEPDALVDDVWSWVDTTRPSRLEQAERAAERGEFLSLAPRLFGDGSMYAELGTISFATVAEALDAGIVLPPATPDTAVGAGWPHELNGVNGPAALDELDDDQLDDLFASLDDQRRAHTRDRGSIMADRLVGLCERALTGTRGHDANGTDAESGDGHTCPGVGARSRGRPLLVATIDTNALLDAARTPGWLLHTLAGGRMKVSARLLQQLVDERGADLRGIVFDDCGQVVGVGRATRVPPQWLRHAIWARDTAVRDPDGTCPIRRADLDHITAWPIGTTDVANLHALGRTWHNVKTTKTWTVTRHDDATTEWRHRHHDWTVRLAPARRSLADPPHDPARQSSPPRSRDPTAAGDP